MLRAGPAAPLARGRPLPALRRCRDRPRRPGRRPAAPAALPLRGLRRPLRRPRRHRFGRASPAAAGPVPAPPPDRPEPPERARLGAPPVAGETVGRMIDVGGARPLRFWWSGTPSSNLARGLLRTREW